MKKTTALCKIAGAAKPPVVHSWNSATCQLRRVWPSLFQN